MSRAGTRQWIGYSAPSRVRTKYHHPSRRAGTERSVSTVRALISPTIASRSGAWSAVTASVYAFSAARCSSTRGSALPRSHSKSSWNVWPWWRRVTGSAEADGGTGACEVVWGMRPIPSRRAGRGRHPAPHTTTAAHRPGAPPSGVAGQFRPSEARTTPSPKYATNASATNHSSGCTSRPRPWPVRITA